MSLLIHIERFGVNIFEGEAGVTQGQPRSSLAQELIIKLVALGDHLSVAENKSKIKYTHQTLYSKRTV